MTEMEDYDYDWVENSGDRITHVSHPDDIQGQIIHDVLAETQVQNAKWGETNHDDFTWLAIIGEEFGEAARAVLHGQFDHGEGNLQEELVQIAAVAVQWLVAIKRRQEES